MSMTAILAATAALSWTMPDGKVVTETQELVPFEDGVRIKVSRGKILSIPLSTATTAKKAVLRTSKRTSLRQMRSLLESCRPKHCRI